MDSAVHDNKIQLTHRYLKDMTVNELVSEYLNIPIRDLIEERYNRASGYSANHERLRIFM